MIKLCYKIENKLNLSKVILLCCCFFMTLELAATARHYTEKIRRINKEFPVNQDATLKIKNKFGKVHIETWDQNLIKFEIEIKVQDRREDRAEDRLEEINIDFDVSESFVAAFTEIADAGGSRVFNLNLGVLDIILENDSDRNKIEINYRVSVPINANLEIENHYGNTYISETNGNTLLNVKYGQLRAEKLFGQNNDIQVGYGHAEIDEVVNADIEVKYSELEIEKCENLELYSKYTNVELEEVDYLDSEVKYGKLYVESVIGMKGDLKYTALEIGELLNDLDLEIGYGPKCEIEYISKEFESIEIDANFTTVHLDFEEGSAFEIDAETSYGNIEIDYSLTDSYEVDKDSHGNSHHLRTSIGAQESTSKRVQIDVAYGNLVIDED